MSITEIAATGLLRMMVPPGPDAAGTELPEGAARAIALASLQASTGVRPSTTQLPSRALKAPAKNTQSRSTRRQTTPSGDYRAKAGRGRPGDGDEDRDAASTFSGLL